MKNRSEEIGNFFGNLDGLRLMNAGQWALRFAAKLHAC